MAATRYFNPSDPSDMLLIQPKKARTSEDLESLAPEVERDIIAHYTRRQHDMRYTVLQPVAAPPVGMAARPTFVFTPRGFATDLGGGVLVYLAGYTTDANDALVEANFKAAMKREIADVLRWRLYQMQREPGVTSAGGQGGTTKGYRGEAEDPFPPWFGRYLKPYDTRPANWAF